MNFYLYLEQISKENFIDANGLFLYKGLVNQKDLKKFNKQNNFRLLTLNEFQNYIKIKEDNFLKLLSEIGLNQYTRYKIYINHKNYCYYIIKNTIIRSLDDKDIKEGIVLLKSNIVQKNYKTIKDLKHDNIGLFVKKDYDNSIKIIGYDKNLLDSYYENESKFIHPILFYGKIKDDGFDGGGKKTSYGASMVRISVVRSDVSGYNILYPIMAYFSRKHLLIPDRGSVSANADKVWKKFHDGKGKLQKSDPIDNYLDPITQNKEDDGKIYNYDNFKPEGDRSNSDILNDPNLSDIKRKYYLKKIRLGDELNWTYFLPDNEVNSMNSDIELLMNNHEKLDANESFLESLAADLFDKRVFR